MENILLILNIIFGLILVLLVLMQKSEGGALGIGVSQESFMSSRSAGNFMTKATAVVATLFIICSLALTIVSRGELTPTSSVLDTIEEKAEEQISSAELKLYNIADKGNETTGFTHLVSASREAIDIANKAYQKQGGVSGISTGLIDLDYLEILY